jgi:hypothetical protein
MEHDFLDDIGEGAYYSDEENRPDKEDDHPTDQLIEELEQIDGEEVIP